MSTEMTDTTLLKRLIRYLVRDKKLLIGAFMLYPITAVTVIIPPYLVRIILDDLIPSKDMGTLNLYCLAYLAAVILEYVSGVASAFAMTVLGQRAMRLLRHELFSHVQKLPAKFFDKNPIGRTLTRLTNDVEALAEIFSSGAVSIVGDFISILFVVGSMLWMSVPLTLYSLLIVPPLLLITAGFRIFSRKAFRAVREQLSRINTFLSEHISGMGVVQIFRQEIRTYNEFMGLNKSYRNANKNAILFDSLLFSVVEFVGVAAVCLLVWYGAELFALGEVGAGTLVAFVLYLRRFFIPIRDLSTKYTLLQSAFAAAERVFSLLDEEVTETDGTKLVSRVNKDIVLRDLWFRYNTNSDHANEEWVLKGVNLTLKKGEHIAIVGGTGSGKTTLLKLLNRSYEVETGRGVIEVDGVPIEQLQLQQLRKLFAVVMQDVYLFSGTIQDNLTLGAQLTLEQVKAAAQAAQAHDFIEAQPEGYQTQLKERGSNFSAGERQLLALTRALACDPEVLILDEATSNIDSHTEALLQYALDTLLENRTAIVVAHRLSTIRKMDRIIVLHRGKIVEQGGHDELMKKRGHYYNLAKLDFADGA